MRLRQHGLRNYMGARLQRRLFAWFGAAILTAGGVATALTGVINHSSEPGWHKQAVGMLEFVAQRFVAVWDDSGARQALATELASDLHVEVQVRDTAGTVLASVGPCHRAFFEHPINRGNQVVGGLRVCAVPSGAWWRSGAPLAPLLAAGIVLWGLSFRLARRLARPLSDLAQVAQDIGAGKLASRARLGHRQTGEVGLLAHAINDMAAKIEVQMADQRALLAMVSHELRTPLARLRVLQELGQAGGRADVFVEMEREIVEMDGLVGQLLANARLDFSALSLHRLDATEMAQRAAHRAGLAPKLLQAGAELAFQGDPTLIARALANLLDNAVIHGGGVRAVRVLRQGDAIHFQVEDGGPGFAAGTVGTFTAFHQGNASPNAAGLGLGLHLVMRIATAHGGRAYAQSLAEGGACVGFTVASPPLEHA